MPLAPRELSGYYPWSEDTVTINTPAVRIVKGDQDRVLISFTPQGGLASTIYFSTKNNLATQVGIPVGTSTSILTFHYGYFGPIVGGEWWGLSPSGAATITVFTMRYLQQLESSNAQPAIHQPSVTSEYSPNGNTVFPGENFADSFQRRWRGCISAIQAGGLGAVGNPDPSKLAADSLGQAVAWVNGYRPIVDR